MAGRRSPPNIDDLAMDGFEARGNASDDDDDDDFDFGDSDGDDAAAAGSTITVHLYGDDGHNGVQFPADVSPYLAELVASAGVTDTVLKHTMLVPHEGLAMCRDYVNAMKTERRMERAGGGGSSSHYRGSSGSKALPTSQAVRRASMCATRLLRAAKAAHLLRLNDFFERLAREFAVLVRQVDIPYPIPLQHLETYSNALRGKLEMNDKRPWSELSKLEQDALGLFFTEKLGDATQSVAVGPGTQGGAPAGDGSETVDVGQLVQPFDNPFEPPTWQPDNEVTRCPDCNREFQTVSWRMQWPVVRSHCRVCGKVKCKDCLTFNADKRYARAFKEGEDPTKLKCCKKCYDEAAHESSLEFVYKLIIHSGLDVVEISTLQLINADFVCAVHKVLFGVRQALTATRGEQLDVDRKRVIMASRRKVAGHLQWLVAVFKCTNFADQEEASDAYAVLQKTVDILEAQRKHHPPSGQAPAVVAGTRRRATSMLGPNAAGGLSAPVSRSLASTSSTAGHTMYPHYILMCSRSCLEPMTEYYGLELLRILNSAENYFPEQGYVRSCRGLAAALFLESVKDSPNTKGVWVPAVLDLLHANPTSDAVVTVRDMIKAMCLGDHTTGMQVAREVSARLMFPDRTVRRDLSNVRTDVEQSGLFLPEKLNEATQLIDAIEDATNHFSGGDEYAARRTLYESLCKFRLVHEGGGGGAHASPDRAMPLNASVGSVPATPGSFTPSSAGGMPPVGRHPNRGPPDRVPLKRMPYFFDPHVEIVAVDLRSLKIMTSNIRPWMISLIGVRRDFAACAAKDDPEASLPPNVSITSNAASELGGSIATLNVSRKSAASPDGGDGMLREGEARYRILYKREDVRKDYVVCNAFAAFNDFFLRRGLIHAPVTTYRVLPTGPERGIIQMVEDSVSLSALTGKGHTPITTWLADHCEGAGSGFSAIDDPRERQATQQRFMRSFVDSARFYTLATFVLGIGDRHRGNVLLCEATGELVHIDFGFVLGELTTTEKMTQRYVRYDDDLANSIERYYPADPKASSSSSSASRSGSVGSRSRAFHADTAKMLLALRPHAGFVRLLLDHWALHGMMSADRIDSFLASRFFVSYNERDAAAEFVKRIEGSIGRNWIQDTAHEYGQRGIAGGVRSSLAALGFSR